MRMITVYGIGFALLLPDLLRRATEREQRLLFGLSFFTPLWGLASAAALEVQFGGNPPDHNRALSLAGLTLSCSLILMWRILRRDALPVSPEQHKLPSPMPMPMRVRASTL
jgi:hypothetical protein